MKLNNKIIGDNAGSVFMLVAVMLPLLLIVLGAAIEAGRIYAVRSKAQHAVDAALLGAVSTANTADVASEATTLFKANFPAGYMGTIFGDNDIHVTPISRDPAVYSMQVHLALPSITAKIVGDASSDINVFSQVIHAFPKGTQIELALVLDNTSSMSDTLAGGTKKIDALKAAAHSLVGILFGNNATVANLHISLVPFDMVVQTGVHSDWMQSASLGKYNTIVTNTGKGFMSNRQTDYLCGTYINSHLTPYGKPCPADNGDNDINDTPPTGGVAWKFRIPFETDFACVAAGACSHTPKLSAYISDLAPMLFSSSNRQEVDNAIDAMGVSGGTRINVGLMWGWYTLSPKWQGMWDAGKPDLPLSPSTTESPHIKEVVLMTDGENTMSGPGSNSDGTGMGGGDDTKTTLLCDKMKKDPSSGIVIYTIGLGRGVSYNPDLLRNCATKPSYFFEAPTEDQLKKVFNEIADNLLYISTHVQQ